MSPPYFGSGLLAVPRLALRIGLSVPRQNDEQCMEAILTLFSEGEFPGMATGVVSAFVGISGVEIHSRLPNAVFSISRWCPQVGGLMVVVGNK